MKFHAVLIYVGQLLFFRTKFSQNGVKNVPYHQAHTKNGVSGGLEKRLTALFLLFALVFVLL